MVRDGPEDVVVDLSPPSQMLALERERVDVLDVRAVAQLALEAPVADTVAETLAIFVIVDVPVEHAANDVLAVGALA